MADLLTAAKDLLRSWDGATVGPSSLGHHMDQIRAAVDAHEADEPRRVAEKAVLEWVLSKKRGEVVDWDEFFALAENALKARSGVVTTTNPNCDGSCHGDWYVSRPPLSYFGR